MLIVVQLNGVALAGDIVVADIAIRSGRSRADDGLAPASATIELRSPNPTGASVAISDKLTVLVDGAKRFTGRVAEVTRTTDSSDPMGSEYTVVAIGPIARLARLLVALPIAAQTAAQRATAVFAAAGIPATVLGGTTYNLAALGATGDPAIAADQVLGSIMNDTAAVIFDKGDGSIIVQFPESRISGDVWTPDPAKTQVELSWDQTDDLVNDATVTYGTGTGSSVNATSPASITTHDRHAVRLSTGLADVGSATRRANSMVARLADPAWEAGGVSTWDQTFRAHTVGAVVTLAPLPPSAPMAGSWTGILEGWVEHYEPGTDGQLIGTYELALSDRQHSAETLIWSAAAPAEHWNTVNPATSWTEVLSNADL